jgi:F-type H+-transporting ATPase subunit delta
MAKLASKVYGEALFQIAVEEDRIDEILEEISQVRQALEENQELALLMEHPKIVREEKVQLVDDCFKGRVSDDVAGFLSVVTAKGRFKELPAMFDYLTLRMKEFQKIGIVTVTSAMELREEQQDVIRKKLLATTDYKSLEITWKVDESLIGGMIIRIGDRVVDSSLKFKLEQLTSQLLKVSLEEKKEGERAS